MPMGKLSIVEYTGKDAGEVLMNILNGYRQDEPREVESETAAPRMGFQPNPAPEAGDEPEEGREEGDA